MVKKLLLRVITFWALILTSALGWGQDCNDSAPSINISKTTSGTIFCEGETISFTGNVTGTATIPYTYQWQVQVDGGSWNDITNATNKDLTNYTPAVGVNRFQLQVVYCDGTTDEAPANSNTSGNISVYENKTGTVSISPDKNNVCPNTNITFKASAANQGGTPTYDWKVNGTTRSTSSTLSRNDFNDEDKIQLFMTSSVPCVDDFSSEIFTVDIKDATPEQPQEISANFTGNICPNSAATFSIDPVARAASYQWTLPTGWTGQTTGTSIDVTTGVPDSGQVLRVKAINDCGESTERTLSVDVGPGKPAAPSAIESTSLICPGEEITLSVTNDPALDYTWDVPTGWTIKAGQGSSEITVTAGNHNQSGTVSVYATNVCLDSDTRTKSITINDPVPGTPGTINGDAVVCPDANVTYSISNVQYADSYIWTYDGAKLQGQTGTSVTFSSGGPGEKDLTVIGINECGESETPGSISITVDDGTPDDISITSPAEDGEFCPQTPDLVFSVPTDSKADDGYTWTVPNGWNIASGQGSNEITVTSGKLNQDGNITVTAKSDHCGEVSASTAVTVKNPAPSTIGISINGPEEVCASDTALVYEIPAVNYATIHEWSIPDNWTITNGEDTNRITVNAGTDDGLVTVVAHNDCGDSGEAVTFTVVSTNAVPDTPGNIISNLSTFGDNICPPAEGVTFEISTVTNANYYHWELPPGWKITDGEGTESIEVEVTFTAAYGGESVSVIAQNICGDSAPSSYDEITVSDFIVADLGDDRTICRNNGAISIDVEMSFGDSKKLIPTFSSSGDGSFTDIPKPKNGGNPDIPKNFTIKYTPGENDLLNDEVVITMNVPEPSSVSSSCGDASDEMTISFRDLPTVTMTGSREICHNTSTEVTFSDGTPGGVVTYTTNGSNSKTINLNNSGSASFTTGNLSSTTTYELVSVAYPDSPTCTEDEFTNVVTITVNEHPTATLEYTQSNFCNSDTGTYNPTLEITGISTGGSYSGPEILALGANGSFSPQGVPSGTYTVTYTFDDELECGFEVVTADITIFEEVVIESIGTDQRVCEEGSAQFEVIASGDGLTYKWFKGDPGSGTLVSGATTSTLVLENISSTDAGNYYVEVSGSSPCEMVSSTVVTLEVDENISITQQPNNSEICLGETAYLSVAAVSGDETLNYQWYKGSPGSGTMLTTATANSEQLEIANADLDDSASYYVVISGSGEYKCEEVTSQTAELTVRDTPTVEISGSNEICNGGNTEIYFINGTPNAIVNYTTNNGSQQAITLDSAGEATLPTGALNVTNDEITTYTYALVSIKYAGAPECSNNVTGSATITVNPTPNVNVSFENDQVTFCNDSYQGSFTPTLTGSGAYIGGVFSAEGLTVNEETGSFTPANAAAGDYVLKYYLGEAGGCSELAATLDIVIYTSVEITSEPFPVAVCTANSTQLEMAASGDNLNYQWYKVAEGDDTEVGTDSPILELNNSTASTGGNYYVIVSGNGACNPVKSETVTVTVDENIVIAAENQPESQDICAGDEATLRVAATASGDNTAIQYQWEYRTTAQDAWSDFGTLETGDLFSEISTGQAGEYRARIDGPDGFSCDTGYSKIVQVKTYEPPTADAGEDFEVCSITTAISLKGSDAAVANYTSLEWTTDGAGTITNAGSLDATYEPAAADYNQEIEFTLTTVFEIGEIEPCSPAGSTKKIKILPLPEITSVTYSGTEFCETDPQTQSPTVTGNYFTPADGTYSVNPATGLNLNAGTGVITPNGSTPGDYTITYTAPSNGVCTETVIATFDVTVGEKPVAEFSYADSPFCSNADNPTPTLTAGAVAGVFSANSPNLKFEDTSTGEINIAASEAGTYTVTNTIATAGGCAEVTATAEVTITKLPVATISYAGSPYCSDGSNPTVTLDTTNGAEAGIFTANSEDLVFADDSTGEINLAASTPGTYTVTNTIAAATGCGDVIATAEIMITKQPVADFKYASTAYCKSAANPLPEFLNDGAAGEFSSASGLIINSSTGEIDLAASTAGTYTVKNIFTAAGGCAEVSKTFDIKIDPISFGGTSIIASLDDKDEYETPAPARLVTACHLGSGEIEVSDDYVGEIIRWESSVDAINWTTISGTADQNLNPYRFTGIETTTLYRAVIKSGSCLETYSLVSIISVIPSDIKPNPVVANPYEVCIGTGTTLTSESGYASGSYLQGGDFQTGQLNTQDPNGWLVDGSPGGYTASADNTKANHWAGTNPHTFGTQRFDSGDPKFAIANGGLTTVLETPVINSIGLTEFHFGFDQAFNLHTGDKILVELSLDGGKTYIKVLQEINGPARSDLFNTFAADNTDFDLSQYAGQLQVRIKFTYIGKNSNSAWALDNFKFPDEPVGLETVWYNEAGIELGRTQDITIPATDLKPGVNTFAVTSYINGCRSEGDGGTTYVDVYAWNHYTGGAGEDQTLSCGIVETILDAELIPAYIDPENPDDRTSLENSGGLWTVSSSTPSGLTYEFEDPTNPKTKFTGQAGTYVLTWTINNEGPCTEDPDTVNITFSDCIALDFDGENDRIEINDPYDGVVSIEAWILPKTTGGTIISGPTFKVTTPSEITPDSRWYHIAISGGKLYIDGIFRRDLSLGSGGSKTLIGAEWIDGIDGEPGTAANFFHGWIEEVRLWNEELTVEQIQFMMNQRLVDNGAQVGEQIPMDVPGGLTYSDLAGYYRLISAEPEPLATSPVKYLPEDMPVNGMTPDRATNKVPGRLINMETNQENTAPLPYYSGNNGVWGTDATWLRPDVWDPPHSGPIEWNIVRTSHDIASGGRDILLLGLISEEKTLDIQGNNPNRWTTGGTGNELYISHYLLLNGIIDLNGESQLVQPMLSIVDENSKGTLFRDQQGTASSYNYNYWSSPVSPATNNADYTVRQVMKDGVNFKENSSIPEDLNFGSEYHFADGGESNPRKVSTYWLHRFHGTADNYFEWDWIGADETLKVGEGYSMKGTSGGASISDPQNYTFKGIPNNGTILMENMDTSGEGENYLVGNPYPSAIDANKFIRDNMEDVADGLGSANIFNGTIYFWSHFAGATHYLEEYIGGYAAYNLSGGVMAYANDERIDNSDPNTPGGRMPRQFIPVGQGFFVNTQIDPAISQYTNITIQGGQVTFKNSQRIYITEEDSDNSVFHSQERKDLNSGTTNNSSSEVEQNKIWLKFKSPKGYHRQILVTADPRTTDNFDLGFDAPMIDENVEDMYWYFSNYQFVIQGVPDFNIERVLDLGINVEQKGALSISIDDLDNIHDEMNIYVADSLLKVVHDLRVEPYETESEAGTFTDRFKLVFQDKTPQIEPEIPIVIEEGPFEVLYVTGTRNILLKNPELLKVDRVYLNNMLSQQVHIYYNIPSENEVELPVKRFNAGVYIVKVHYEGGILTRKIILE